MADLLAHGSARGPARLPFLHRPAAVVASHSTPHGFLRVVVDARDGEPADQLGARARAALEELMRIAETVAQTWPRCDGETPSPAEHWLAAGILDADVSEHAAVVRALATAARLERRGTRRCAATAEGRG